MATQSPIMRGESVGGCVAMARCGVGWGGVGVWA